MSNLYLAVCLVVFVTVGLWTAPGPFLVVAAVCVGTAVLLGKILS